MSGSKSPEKNGEMDLNPLRSIPGYEEFESDLELVGELYEIAVHVESAVANGEWMSSVPPDQLNGAREAVSDYLSIYYGSGRIADRDSFYRDEGVIDPETIPEDSPVGKRVEEKRNNFSFLDDFVSDSQKIIQNAVNLEEQETVPFNYQDSHRILEKWRL